jgi:hypothetical protein
MLHELKQNFRCIVFEDYAFKEVRCLRDASHFVSSVLLTAHWCVARQLFEEVVVVFFSMSFRKFSGMHSVICQPFDDTRH